MKKALISTALAALTIVGVGGATVAHAGAPTPPPWDFYAVPQLGQEPVRGSGCGGDGSVGDVIPDGYWRGYATSVDPASGIQFDLVCVYFSPQTSSIATVPDGWLTNNNARTRFVPTAPAFFSHGTRFQLDGSVPFAQNAPFEDTDAWLYIENGQAQWMIGAPATGAPVPANNPAPPATDRALIPAGVIEDGVHFGYAVNVTTTSISFDRVDVEADGSWTNNNPKIRTLPVNPDFWSVNLFPGPGQPVEIHVQGQRVTMLTGALSYPVYDDYEYVEDEYVADEYVEDEYCGC
jgi:hypothetical protein